MNRAEYALALMAEATTHGITIIYGNRQIGITTKATAPVVEMCEVTTGLPGEHYDSRETSVITTHLRDELDDYANEIWAILHHHRKAIS